MLTYCKLWGRIRVRALGKCIELWDLVRLGLELWGFGLDLELVLKLWGLGLKVKLGLGLGFRV